MLGQNVINPEKGITSSTKTVSREVFKDFLDEKHGLMPAFKEVSEDATELEALYRFVRKLKHQNWEYEPPEKDKPRLDIEMKEQPKEPDKRSLPSGRKEPWSARYRLAIEN